MVNELEGDSLRQNMSLQGATWRMKNESNDKYTVDPKLGKQTQVSLLYRKQLHLVKLDEELCDFAGLLLYSLRTSKMECH